MSLSQNAAPSYYAEKRSTIWLLGREERALSLQTSGVITVAGVDTSEM